MWRRRRGLRADRESCAATASATAASPPPPPPPPPPPGNPASFETGEYNEQYGLGLINASTAYAAGATGEGIIVAVVDTGIVQEHPELTGRIHPTSTDIVGSRVSLEDTDGHGTGVAGVIAANKNNRGGHGVAFQSSVMALRADTPDSCENDDEEDGGCRYSDTNVAAAIDYAIDNGARVINLSLGREVGDNDALSRTFAAMRRAVNAGIFLVISAGNDGEDDEADATNPNYPANFARTAEAMGFAVAVGAVECPGRELGCSPDEAVITPFSNRAGGSAGVYLMAPGSRILTPFLNNEDGDPQLARYSGTSFSAPHVAGALALLLQAFPHLRGNEALQILFETARDLGDPGTDEVYGRGLIDLAAAFQPVGSSSVSFATAEAVPLGALLQAPTGPYGDWMWRSGLVEGAVLRDKFRRPFRFDAARPDAVSNASAMDAMESAAASSLARTGVTRAGPAEVMMRLTPDRPHALRNLPSDIYQTQPDLSFAFRQGGLSLQAGRGFATPAPAGGAGVSVLSETQFSGAVARLTGQRDWAAVSYRTPVLDGALGFHVRASGGDASAFQAAALTFTREGQTLGFETGSGRETYRSLGGFLAARFGEQDGSETRFAAGLWSGALPLGWRGAARVEHVTGEIALPLALQREQALGASAWSIGADRAFAGGRLGFTLAQPLRVERGAVSALVPVLVDEDNVTLYERRYASLAPSGREISMEAAWRVQLGGATAASLAARLTREPGHIAGARPKACSGRESGPSGDPGVRPAADSGGAPQARARAPAAGAQTHCCARAAQGRVRPAAFARSGRP